MNNDAESALRELLEKCFYIGTYGDIKSALDKTQTVSGVDTDLHTKLLPYLTDEMRRDMEGADGFNHGRVVWGNRFETEAANGTNADDLKQLLTDGGYFLVDSPELANALKNPHKTTEPPPS